MLGYDYFRGGLEVDN